MKKKYKQVKIKINLVNFYQKNYLKKILIKNLIHLVNIAKNKINKNKMKKKMII
jgi:hypothetical protein